MRQRFEKQKMRIIVGLGGHACIAAVSGEGVEERVKDDHPGDLFDNIPKEPGVYLWQGDYWFEPGGWCGSEPIDADEGFVGTFAMLHGFRKTSL